MASGTSLQIQQDIHINGKSQRNGPAVIVAPGTLDGFCLVLFRVLLTQHHSIKGIKSPLVYPWAPMGHSRGWLVGIVDSPNRNNGTEFSSNSFC